MRRNTALFAIAVLVMLLMVPLAVSANGLFLKPVQPDRVVLIDDGRNCMIQYLSPEMCEIIAYTDRNHSGNLDKGDVIKSVYRFKGGCR